MREEFVPCLVTKETNGTKWPHIHWLPYIFQLSFKNVYAFSNSGGKDTPSQKSGELVTWIKHACGCVKGLPEPPVSPPRDMRVSQCRRTVRSEGRREGALGCGRAQEGNIHSEELWVLVVEPKKLQIHSATKYSYFQNDKFSLLRPLTPHLSPVPHSIHSL